MEAVSIVFRIAEASPTATLAVLGCLAFWILLGAVRAGNAHRAEQMRRERTAARIVEGQ